MSNVRAQISAEELLSIRRLADLQPSRVAEGQKRVRLAIQTPLEFPDGAFVECCVRKQEGTDVCIQGQVVPRAQRRRGDETGVLVVEVLGASRCTSHLSAPPAARALALPDSKALGQLVSGLLGKEVPTQVDTVDGERLERPLSYARYVDDENRARVVIVADEPSTLRLGSALLMMPEENAMESLATGELDECALDGFDEILNVAASLFNRHGYAHLRLDGVWRAPEDVPEDARALLDACDVQLRMRLTSPAGESCCMLLHACGVRGRKAA